MSWSSAFSSERQERAFRRQQLSQHTKLDRVAGAVFSALFWIASFKFRHALTPWRLLSGLGLAGLGLVPLLWCKVAGEESYGRHRLWIISAARLSAVLLPGLPEIVQGLGPEEAPRTLRGRLAALSFALRLPKHWGLSLTLMLPLWLQCLVHAAAVAAALPSFPAICASPFFRNPGSTRRLDSMADLMGVWAGSVVGYGGSSWRCGGGSGDGGNLDALSDGMQKAGPGLQPPLEGPAAAAAQCSCIVVLATLLLLLGYALPTFAVALLERKARSAFVAAHLGDGRWDASDLYSHLGHDWLSTALAFGGLLPVLLAAAWHGAAAAALYSGACPCLLTAAAASA